MLPEFSNLDQESPTLDLTNDCFQFVTGFFEVISTSAPHIYYSALLLSPPISLVQKLYGPQAKSLARVIQGVPTTRDPSFMSARSFVDVAAWSPCSRFIATTWGGHYEAAVLDAVTLEQLHTMYLQDQYIFWRKFIFSPNGHLLTGYSYSMGCLVSWDLQTGGPTSNIKTNGNPLHDSMSYSGSGTILWTLFDRDTITAYNVFSGTQISSHSIQGSIASTIWTHGEHLQLAAMESQSITIWEVSFTPGHAPTQIHSLPIPENFSSDKFILLPTLYWLAFIFQGRIIIWDTQHQKVLLDCKDVRDSTNMSFSLDGHFFICGTEGPEFHLWKESPNGYLPHQQFISSAESADPLISPNGKWIISLGGPVLQLWHTKNSPASPPSITTPAFQHTQNLLEFSPDKSLVAVTWQLSNTVTILDVKSGSPQLVIDTGTRVCGMRITESKIVVVGDEKIITWELPTGDCVFNAQGNINNSVQTTTFEHSSFIEKLYASISPNLDYMALKSFWQSDLNIYSMHTGKKLAVAKSNGWLPGFAPDGNRVWCTTDDGEVDQWAIIKDDESNTTKLEHLGNTGKPSSGFPWHSSYGYQVTDDGWILSSSGKRLLWLPHQWQSANKIERRWSGRFLAQLKSGSPEAIILDLEV